MITKMRRLFSKQDLSLKICIIGVGLPITALLVFVGLLIADLATEDRLVTSSKTTELVALNDNYVVLTNGSMFGFTSSYAGFVQYGVETNGSIQIKTLQLTDKVSFTESDYTKPKLVIYKEVTYGGVSGLKGYTRRRYEFILPPDSISKISKIDFE